MNVELIEIAQMVNIVGEKEDSLSMTKSRISPNKKRSSVVVDQSIVKNSLKKRLREALQLKLKKIQ